MAQYGRDQMIPTDEQGNPVVVHLGTKRGEEKHDVRHPAGGFAGARQATPAGGGVGTGGPTGIHGMHPGAGVDVPGGRHRGGTRPGGGDATGGRLHDPTGGGTTEIDRGEYGGGVGGPTGTTGAYETNLGGATGTTGAYDTDPKGGTAGGVRLVGRAPGHKDDDGDDAPKPRSTLL